MSKRCSINRKNNHAWRKRCRAFTSLLVAVAGTNSFGASATWSGATDANWSTGTNWSGSAAPGATTGTTNADTATFNSNPANGTTVPLVIDANRNIKFINFETSAGNFNIGSTGGNAIIMTASGSINLNNTVTNTAVTETVSAPLLIMGALNISSNLTTGTSTLNILGNITGNAAGTLALSVSGVGTNNNTIGGVIANGTGTVTFTHNNVGTWVFTGANTYTGATTLNGGIQKLSGANGSIANSAATVNQTATLVWDNSTNVNNARLGSQTLTLNGGTFSFLGGNTSAASVNNFTINASTSAGFTTTAAGSGTSTITLGTITRGSHSGIWANLGSADLATGRVAITTTPTLVNGILPWASDANSGSFLTWTNISGTNYLMGNSLLGGTTSTFGGNVVTDHVRVATTPAALTANNVAGSLAIAQTAATTVDLGGFSQTLDNGALMTSGDFNATIQNGSITSGTGNPELFIHALSTLNAATINAVITNNGATPIGVTKLGPGTTILGGTNTYTGETYAAGGTLRIAAAGSLNAGSAVTAASGTLDNLGTINGTVNALGIGSLTNSGTINGLVTSQVTGGQTTVNVTNNNGGNLAGGVTIIAGSGPASPNANATAVVATGHLQLNGGSTTGAITNNGQITLSGTTAITSIGTISGSGAMGGFNDGNTAAGGKTLTLANGSSFSYFRPSNTTAGTTATSTLQVAGNGSTSITWFGYNSGNAGTANVTFNGGTFNISKVGQNNSGAQSFGTFNITNGSSIIVGTGGFEHGAWNITNGNMTISAGGMSQGNGNGTAASALQVTVNNSSGGTGSTLTITGNINLGQGSAATSSQNNFITIGNAGTVNVTGTVGIGTGNAQTAETDTINLQSGGKFVVSGTLQAAAGTGQTRVFNWTGGQLSVGTITPSANFNGTGNISATTLTNNAGTLAPGSNGIAGKTTVNGNYVQSGTGSISIDIGGTTRASGFQTGQFDYLVTGAGFTTTIGGTLSTQLISGFTPASTDKFAAIGQPNTAGAISGSFTNVASGGLLETTDHTGLFRVYYGAGVPSGINSYEVTLTNFVSYGNQWALSTGGNWQAGSTANWTTNTVPNSAGTTATFASYLTSGPGTVNVPVNQTVGAMIFNNATNAYTIAGAGGVTFDNVASNGTISNVAGSHVISTPVTVAGNNNLDITVNNASDTITLSGGLGATGTVKTLGSGNVIIDQPTGTRTINAFASSGSGYFILRGTSSSITSVAASVTAGQLLDIQSGVWQLKSNDYLGKLKIEGGSVTSNANDRFSMSNSGATFEMTGGTLTTGATQIFGIRFGNHQSASQVNQVAFTGTQTGGTIDFTAGVGNFNLGGSSPNAVVTSYAISGGSILIGSSTNAQNLELGAGASTPGSTAVFTLSGSAKVVVSNIIKGDQAGADQQFAFNGGTLVAKTIDATNLAYPSEAVGTFKNAGGTLSPGDATIIGRTSITGNYTVTAGALAVDIGGTSASSNYQEALGTGKYDNVAVSGTATLGGSLNVNLTNNLAPTTSNTFDIVTATTLAANTFTNGATVTASDGSVFNINYDTTNNKVQLQLATGGLNEWQGASGTNWTAGVGTAWTKAEPNSTLSSARFGNAPVPTGAITVNLDAPRTVQGLYFSSSTRSYTIAGANTLTIGDANNPAKIDDPSGNHTINTPIAIGSSGLSISVVNGLTIGGNISGGSTGLTKTSSGVLTLNGTNTYSGGTSINNGTVKVNGSITGPVTVASIGILGGTGTVNGTVSVASGGQIAPGNSIGSLTVLNNITLDGNATMEISTGSVTADKLNATGFNITLNPSSSILNVTDLGSTPANGQTFDLFDGTIVNTFSAINLPTLPGGFAWHDYGSGVLFDYSTGEIKIDSSGPVTAQWNVNANGNWSVNSNWTPSSPNGVGTTATFGTIITAPRTVTVDTPQTVSTINFNNSNKYTVGGSSTLTLNAASTATINVTSGSHDITAPLLLSQDTTVTVTNSSDTLRVSNLQSTTSSITKLGAGTLEANAIQANGLAVNGGTVKLSTLSPTPITSANKLNSLSFSGGGSLDLTNNALQVVSTDATDATRDAVWAQVVSGQNNFDNNGQVTWDGQGIVSSTARSTNVGLGVDALVVAVASNHDLALLSAAGGAAIPYDSGNPWLGTISTIGADDILVRFTYAGDTNLDGTVTIDDYNNIDATFSGLLPTSYGWVSGDFDFSGAITIDDYNAIDTGFLYQGGQLTQGMLAARAAMFGATYVAHLEALAAEFSAVPEPSTIGVMMVGAAGLLTRRRRRA